MRLSELLGLEIRLESGAHLGSVHDVRAELGDGSIRVTGLVVAKFGLLERLGIGTPGSADPVAWERVLRADRRGIVVRDGQS